MDEEGVHKVASFVEAPVFFMSTNTMTHFSRCAQLPAQFYFSYSRSSVKLAHYDSFFLHIHRRLSACGHDLFLATLTFVYSIVFFSFASNSWS